jgi:hypothetical protein
MVLRRLTLLLAVILAVGPSLCLLDGDAGHVGSPCHPSLAVLDPRPPSAKPPVTDGAEDRAATLSPIPPLDQAAPPPKA